MKPNSIIKLFYIYTKPFIFFTLLVFCVQCKKPDDKLSPIPAITDLAINKNMVKSGNSKDTLYMSFNIQDGDGDLDNAIVLFKDSRNNTVLTYNFPTIPNEVKDAYTGAVSGNCTVGINCLNLTVRDTFIHKNYDTLQYSVTVQDNAFHVSNMLLSDTVYIKR